MFWTAVGAFSVFVLAGGLYICRKWWLWKPALSMGTVFCLLNWQHHELTTVLLVYALMVCIVAVLHAAEFAHEMNLRLHLPHPEDCSCGGRMAL